MAGTDPAHTWRPPHPMYFSWRSNPLPLSFPPALPHTIEALCYLLQSPKSSRVTAALTKILQPLPTAGAAIADLSQEVPALQLEVAHGAIQPRLYLEVNTGKSLPRGKSIPNTATGGNKKILEENTTALMGLSLYPPFFSAMKKSDSLFYPFFFQELFSFAIIILCSLIILFILLLSHVCLPLSLYSCFCLILLPFCIIYLLYIFNHL
jgi:hypothetical protein